MQSGLVAKALFHAIKSRATARGVSQSSLLLDIGLGASTIQKLRAGKPIRQTTVATIVNALGVNVRDVLTQYQQSEATK
jgi:DNA-binding Xre family transcriptional regulator